MDCINISFTGLSGRSFVLVLIYAQVNGDHA